MLRLIAGIMFLGLALALPAGRSSVHAQEASTGRETLGRVTDFSVQDTSGQSRTPADWRSAKLVVLVFLGVECPVSNGSAPELARLHAEFSAAGVLFLGVHGDPDVTAEAARNHAREYQLPFAVWLDPGQSLARQTGARTMPESVVLTTTGEVVYRGRIDDRYTDDGKRRTVITRRDLRAAIASALRGEAPRPATTPTFGCPLPALRSADASSQ